MDNQSTAQFGLKPRRLGRHDVARISNVHQLLHADRIECESDLHLSAIYTALQLTQATDAAYEVNALV